MPSCRGWPTRLATARGMIRPVQDPHFGEVLHPGVVPMMTGGPKNATGGANNGGGIAWAGPAVGAHNEIIYGGLLGRGADDLARLAQEGVI